MAEDFTNNPPQFDGLEDTLLNPKEYGTVLKYGSDGLTVTGVLELDKRRDDLYVP